MIMKLMAEKKLVPFSEDFYDTDNPDNYYVRGVSDYIKDTFDENEIGGESWSKYAAGYMWGVTGVLYNPEKMTEEEAYRHIQKCSMDSGNTMVESATMVMGIYQDV